MSGEQVGNEATEQAVGICGFNAVPASELVKLHAQDPLGVFGVGHHALEQSFAV